MAYTFKKLTDVPATTALGPTDQVLVVGTDGVKKVPSSEVGGGGGKVEWFSVDGSTFNYALEPYRGKSTDLSSLQRVTVGEVAKLVDENKEVMLYIVYQGAHMGTMRVNGYSRSGSEVTISYPKLGM